MPESLAHPDRWASLRRYTAARIALGRTGGSLPTGEVLDFSMAHAEARDAVHSALDVALLAAGLKAMGLPCITLRTRAPDRQTYLHRPDLGRRLDARSLAELNSLRHVPADVALIAGDGLSAMAAQNQVIPLLDALAPMLRNAGLGLCPLCIVEQARVAVQDEIGAALKARLAIILLGERPGLGTSESLGAYLVHEPRLGRTDAERNCVSNIRPGGLSPTDAAGALHYLVVNALQRRISGVALKDDRGGGGIPLP